MTRAQPFKDKLICRVLVPLKGRSNQGSVRIPTIRQHRHLQQPSSNQVSGWFWPGILLSSKTADQEIYGFRFVRLLEFFSLQLLFSLRSAFPVLRWMCLNPELGGVEVDEQFAGQVVASCEVAPMWRPFDLSKSTCFKILPHLLTNMKMFKSTGF